MAAIRRAILSVFSKEGLLELASFLAGQDVELISTGGTAAVLREAGIPVTRVSDVTGFPEVMDGRVKTLHPRVAGGILGRTHLERDRVQMEEHGIQSIDLVVIDLYPFEEISSRPGCERAEAIEMIDIGGPTMIRAAAKNHDRVTVLVDPADYSALRDEMLANDGGVQPSFRAAMAAKAFRRTAAYDATIAGYLTEDPFPERLVLPMTLQQPLRYGENPHQAAALYREDGWIGPSVTTAEQLGGKKLSYNNLSDADAAMALVREFDDPAAVVVKHTNPCGVARHVEDITQAFEAALETDPKSAFGGIVALNRPVDLRAAEAIAKIFFEVIIAPGYEAAALERLRRKKNLRLLQLPDLAGPQRGAMDLKRIHGGYLVTEWDDEMQSTHEVVSRRAPTPDEKGAMAFAWAVCKHVRSNAIVLTSRDQAVGIGAGQMSRVDSVEIAVRKAQLSTAGCALASDAFFPFRDGVDAAAAAGATAIVQPGGSVRDAEVIEAADEHDMAMVFTRMRHFRH
jgi:phosphoribosylaminoimidazolecarboxamide formyltransferase / IMP cyclohydrolase